MGQVLALEKEPAMVADSFELKTERLLLRPLSLNDVADVFEFATSPEWAKYLSDVPQPYTWRNAEENVARCLLTSWATNPDFAIVLDAKVIGIIDLRVEPDQERAEVGYSMSSYHWGKGLVSEAVRVVMDCAFTRYDVKKVYARIDVRNERSWRMAERVGMVREGLLRSHEIIRGERWDVLYYGILRQEWEVDTRVSS